MKCHSGVDAGSGLVHTMTVTAANQHDIPQAAALIREDDEVVYGDSGYLGIQKRPKVMNVEHAFRIIKCQFGCKKTVYRGLKKNENRLYALEPVFISV